MSSQRTGGRPGTESCPVRRIQITQPPKALRESPKNICKMPLDLVCDSRIIILAGVPQRSCLFPLACPVPSSCGHHPCGRTSCLQTGVALRTHLMYNTDEPVMWLHLFFFFCFVIHRKASGIPGVFLLLFLQKDVAFGKQSEYNIGGHHARRPFVLGDAPGVYTPGAFLCLDIFRISAYFPVLEKCCIIFVTPS